MCFSGFIIESKLSSDSELVPWLRSPARLFPYLCLHQRLLYRRLHATIRNYWMGLDQLNCLTNSADYMMRVEMEGYLGESHWLEYFTFRIGNEQSSYRLTLQDYNPKSTRFNQLMYNHGMKFSTRDNDNDLSPDINRADQYGRLCLVNRHTYDHTS